MARRNNKLEKEQRAHTAASMLMGAIIHKAFDDVFGKDNDCAQTSVDVPDDGTAVEFPVQEGFEIFISEEGKPMIRRKIEGDGETAKEEGNPITYEDIAKKLFLNKTCYFNNGNVIKTLRETSSVNCYEVDNSVSKAQVKRLLAFNKLQNIALYLNGDWKPKFGHVEDPYVIVKTVDDEFLTAQNKLNQTGAIYFKTKELAEEAVRIMGKESLNDLFNTNW